MPARARPSWRAVCCCCTRQLPRMRNGSNLVGGSDATDPVRGARHIVGTRSSAHARNDGVSPAARHRVGNRSIYGATQQRSMGATAQKKTAIQRGDAEDWRLAADGRRIAGHKCIAPAGLCCAAARLEQAASHREQLVGRTGEGDYEVAPRPICGASSNMDVHSDELHCSSQARSVPSNDFEEVASLMREWIELDQSPFPFASSAAVAWSWP